MEREQKTSKPGRPSKGARWKTTLRLPLDMKSEVDQYIAQHGGTLNDLCVELLNARFNSLAPKVAPAPEDRTQNSQGTLRLSA